MWVRVFEEVREHTTFQSHTVRTQNRVRGKEWESNGIEIILRDCSIQVQEVRLAATKGKHLKVNYRGL